MNPTTTRTQRAQKPNTSEPLEIDEAATAVVMRYGSVILDDAIRYSRTRADAEDAYQRSLEILLTKAPTTDPEELVPWLRVVVKNEALAIANSNKNKSVELPAQHLQEEDLLELPPDAALETFADLEMSFEALGHLSNDQIRCLIGQSKGLTYDEISEATGFSRRKVSRCLERGRMVFAQKVEAIAAGSECERMEPLIHRVLAADAEAALELRPHLRHCIACRGRLRTYSAAPRNVAALLPPSLVLIEHPTRGLVERALDWASALADRVAVQFLGAERWIEVSGAKKAVAVAALATATATGGVAVHTVADRAESAARERSATSIASHAKSTRPLLDVVDVPAVERPARRRHKRRPAPVATPAPTPVRSTPSAEIPSSPEPIGDGSSEFLPEARGSE